MGVIREVNDAIANGSPAAVAKRLHPDVVWEHNIGGGSPEEGVYRGRESVIRLFERIVETWDYIRPEPSSIDQLDEGRYRVRGELLAKHRTSDMELRASYEQHLEVREGELVKGSMKTGETVTAAESGNVVAVRRFVDAFNRRDLESVAGGMDPDVQLEEWREAPGARSYRGPEGVQAALDSWFESWEWMSVEIEELREAGERVFFSLHQRAKGRNSGIEVEIESWNVHSFRDGKLIRVQLFLERGPALEAAGITPNHEEER